MRLKPEGHACPAMLGVSRYSTINAPMADRGRRLLRRRASICEPNQTAGAKRVQHSTATECAR
eukprot:9823395-Lingulodinium_polyedra.AAC.1